MKNKHPLFSFKYLAMDMARLVCSVLIPILRIKRYDIEGKAYRQNISGGALIAANHSSFLDPFIVGVSFWKRRLHFLAAEVVMKGKLRSALIKGVGGIKIDRTKADIEAINTSTAKLKEGFLLAIFPQGGIDRGDSVDTVKSGAVLIALRSGAPIIPMYIAPKGNLLSRRVVVIGEAINPKEHCAKIMPSTADIGKISELLAKEMNRCKEAYIKILEEKQ